MKKNLFFAALALTALAGCTSDEFVGDQSLQDSNENRAINFNPRSKAVTRATSNSGTVAQMLDGQMKIFGVKKTNGSGSDPATYSTVFDNYVLWSNTTNVTTSNPDATTVTAEENGWEYVTASAHEYGSTGTTGTTGVQYIKYWDWSTDEYHFVAGSPVKHFSYTITAGEIASASVTGIAGHINPNSGDAITTDPVYIAAPVKKQNANYGTDVQFSFTRQQAFVRVGVYEIISGYKITEIKFYPYDESSDAWGSTPGNNIVLASKVTDPAKYFQGATNGTATVTYNWTTPSYTFDYSSLTVQKNWYGGAYNYAAVSETPAWEMATSSTETNVDKLYGKDSDRGTNGYFTVIPMKSGGTAQPILVKCDYVLKALDTDETIKVSGATAAIPAAFTYWNPNTTYTYLFKISDNTNGKTGSSQPYEGIYPITFDAVVTTEASGTEQGYITSVSTPSITTYQAGSVTTNGVQYTTANGAIYFTAQNDETGALLPLSALNNTTPAVGMVNVYKVSAGTTEADLILTRPGDGDAFATTIGAAAWSINGQSVASGKWASFTPDVAGTYAIEYIYSVNDTPAITARSYKVVVVE